MCDYYVGPKWHSFYTDENGVTYHGDNCPRCEYIFKALAEGRGSESEADTEQDEELPSIEARAQDEPEEG